MKKKATKKKKPPNPITEIRWMHAHDSLGRQLSDLKCQLNDLSSITEIRWMYADDSLGQQLSDLKCQLNDLSYNIDALTYLYNHSKFDDGKLKRKTKKKTK